MWFSGIKFGGSLLNPLSVILKEHKLSSPNYIDWKLNLDIVLTTAEYKFVLIEIYPEQSVNEATKKEAQAYRRWKKADEMCWPKGPSL